MSKAFTLCLVIFIPASYGFSMTKWTSYHHAPNHQNNKGAASFRLELALAASDSDDYSYEEEGSSSPGSKRRRPIRLSNPKAKVAELNRKEAQARHEQALNDPTLLTNVQFQERGDMHPATKRALAEVMGLQSMTEIQSKTYAEALSGKSVMARSRTGTGKTLAFLLPSLERILANEQRQYHPGRNVGALIIAPTRELAVQISDQAKDLLSFHNENGLSVLCLYGGTRIQKDIGLLNENIPTILVCTPGRLQDHLKDTRLRGRKFRDVMEETSILVLDETDSLLKSFPQEMKTILSCLPRSAKRQTLLFSATLPKKMKAAFEAVLPADYSLVDCVGQTNVKAETNMQVKQTYVVLDSMEKYISALVAIVLLFVEEERDEKHKIMVFLPTTRLVKFFSELFDVGIKKDARVFQMHSKMSQSARNRVSNAFRSAKEGVLFTTDVSARGLDYPDVSVVLQYGYPNTQEGYIHRVGRTGRAGNQGQGILVLLPFEQKVLKSLRSRGLGINERLVQLVKDLPPTSSIVEPARRLVSNGHKVLLPASETAYLSLLAYYSARADSLGLTSEQVLDIANCFSRASGLQKPPEISATLASSLKLDKILPDPSRRE